MSIRQIAALMDGSSPRARGAYSWGSCGSNLLRIIPACAGSMTSSRPSVVTIADHPRVRGEHRDEGIQDTITSGSSPRARGASQGSPVWWGARGIIPACAGSILPDQQVCRRSDAFSFTFVLPD